MPGAQNRAQRDRLRILHGRLGVDREVIGKSGTSGILEACTREPLRNWSDRSEEPRGSRKWETFVSTSSVLLYQAGTQQCAWYIRATRGWWKEEMNVSSLITAQAVVLSILVCHGAPRNQGMIGDIAAYIFTFLMRPYEVGTIIISLRRLSVVITS